MGIKDPRPPDTLLLIGPGCTHCSTVLKELCSLVKEGIAGRLEVVNIVAHSEVARELGVRSVPWIRIGPFELTGLRSRQELSRWAALASRNDGWGEYYAHLLESGQLTKVLESIRRDSGNLQKLVHLLFQPDLPLTVRVGISAVLEDLKGENVLTHVVPKLKRLARSSHPHTRADACHYLGLTEDPEVIPAVRTLLTDDDPQVREIAMETLFELDSD